MTMAVSFLSSPSSAPPPSPPRSPHLPPSPALSPTALLLPPETNTGTTRRFIPEPVETVSRSNRVSSTQERKFDVPTSDKSNVRSFVPQPIETSHTTSKKPINDVQSQNRVQDAPDLSPPKRLLPQPIETSTTSSKPRKFVPEVIHTTKRSRKSGDLGPTILPSGKTEASPDDLDHSHRYLNLKRPATTFFQLGSLCSLKIDELHPPPEPHYSLTALRKQQVRQHSFRVPDLPSIQSSGDSEESGSSNRPSLASSSSTASNGPELHRRTRRRRGSHGDVLDGSNASLITRTAEKQLREQIMAAYPNENHFEPVEHFAGDWEDEDGLNSRRASRTTPKASQNDFSGNRRESAAGWDAKEMRRYHGIIQERQYQEYTTVQPELEAQHGKEELSHSPAKDFSKTNDFVKSNHGRTQENSELKKMRSAASPPMAGQDLRFARCQSPQRTRLDMSQYPYKQKPQGPEMPEEHTGLWTLVGGGGGGEGEGAGKQTSGPGLWMGTSSGPPEPACHSYPVIPSGLRTPSSDRDESSTRSHSASHDKSQFPPSPPCSQSDDPKMSCLDSKLASEQGLALEFHDDFVTQVYNYLSLGYPSLARKFDMELSKISKIPVDELRQNDGNTDAKGYIPAPQNSEGDAQTGMPEGNECRRWDALKRYVREWARQQQQMGFIEGMNGRPWGETARRGSWAI